MSVRVGRSLGRRGRERTRIGRRLLLEKGQCRRSICFGQSTRRRWPQRRRVHGRSIYPNTHGFSLESFPLSPEFLRLSVLFTFGV